MCKVLKWVKKQIKLFENRIAGGFIWFKTTEPAEEGKSGCLDCKNQLALCVARSTGLCVDKLGDNA